MVTNALRAVPPEDEVDKDYSHNPQSHREVEAAEGTNRIIHTKPAAESTVMPTREADVRALSGFPLLATPYDKALVALIPPRQLATPATVNTALDSLPQPGITQSSFRLLSLIQRSHPNECAALLGLTVAVAVSSYAVTFSLGHLVDALNLGVESLGVSPAVITWGVTLAAASNERGFSSHTALRRSRKREGSSLCIMGELLRMERMRNYSLVGARMRHPTLKKRSGSVLNEWMNRPPNKDRSAPLGQVDVTLPVSLDANQIAQSGFNSRALWGSVAGLLGQCSSVAKQITRAVKGVLTPTRIRIYSSMIIERQYLTLGS